MGFTITGSKFITIPNGEVDSLYGRIDCYSYRRNTGTLDATITLYGSSRGAKSNELIEYPVNFMDYNIIGVDIMLSGSMETITYPTLINIPITSSVLVNVPIYTNHITSESISYYDFDDNGDVVEKFKWQYYSQSVQIGEQQIEQNILNTELLNGNVFPYMYNVVTSEYKKLFGEENVINS
jgi:hypothetical protein